MDEEENKKSLLSYEQVTEIIDKRISCDESATHDKRIVRIEMAAKQTETDRKKWILQEKNILLFQKILDKPIPTYPPKNIANNKG